MASSLSLFQLILEQQSTDPGRPLDYCAFPEPADQRAQYAPGAWDALAGRFGEKPDGWQRVKEAISGLALGHTSAAQLEPTLKTIEATTNIDELLNHLSWSDLTESVTQAFWTIAKQSRDYEAVKWGIAIGSLRAPDAKVPELLTFARHSEFTPFAVIALLRASNERRELRSCLPPLLAILQGWGVVRLIDLMTRDGSFSDDIDIVRAMVIYGVENSDGLLVEVAHIIARQLNSAIFEIACSDSRLFHAIVWLMDEILIVDHPLGGILDIPEPRRLFDDYRRFLVGRRPDTWVLHGMRALRRFLLDSGCPFVDRIEQVDALSPIIKERMQANVIREGLEVKDTRWMALRIIDEERMVDLLPDLEKLATDKPEGPVLELLGKYGDHQQLQFLLDLLPRIVQVEARAGRPFSSTNILGRDRDEVESEYAAIVRVTGKIGSPEAIRQLKLALADFNPTIRAAACQGAEFVPRTTVDEELTGLINERRNDPLPYVREAAEAAFKVLEINGPERSRKSGA